ncbi:MAG TPA: hypothetical protein VKX40_10930 [Aequorivita sp.]|nr:hypothetical protein [Aequorivita sp.]
MKESESKSTSSTSSHNAPFFSKDSYGGFFSKESSIDQPFFNSNKDSKKSQSSIAGLSPFQNEEQFVGGRTFGEFVGDIVRPVGTGIGNIVGDIAGAVTGINISSTTNSGPTWNNHGHFDWRVGLSTTGRSGWLVQKINNTYRAEDAAGTALGGAAPTSEYYEAWAVDASGNVSPNVGVNNDYWIRPNKGTGSKGHWSMKGKVYYTTVDPTLSGFTPGGVADAGILLSSTTSPGSLGIARLHRYAQGTWDSTGTTPTHTGSAK